MPNFAKTIRKLRKEAGEPVSRIPSTRFSRERAAHLAIIPLGPDSHRGSSSLPEGCSLLWPTPSQRKCPAFASHSVSRAGSPLLFGLAPRGVFRASFVAKRAVGSYPTFSPLPANQHFEGVLQVSLRNATVLDFTGGLFSVALSVGTPRGVASRVYPLRVTRHRALRCSDFPPSRITPGERSSALPKSILLYPDPQ